MTLKIGGAKNHRAVITNARKKINKKRAIIKNSVIRRSPKSKQNLDFKLRQLQINIAALALQKEAKAGTVKTNINPGDQVVRRSLISKEKLLYRKLAAMNLQEEIVKKVEAKNKHS